MLLLDRVLIIHDVARRRGDRDPLRFLDPLRACLARWENLH
jgi:hypothetical protein